MIIIRNFTTKAEREKREQKGKKKRTRAGCSVSLITSFAGTVESRCCVSAHGVRAAVVKRWIWTKVDAYLLGPRSLIRSIEVNQGKSKQENK
jgi:hypothetical protein